MKKIKNKVQLIGHVGMTPEVKNLSNNKTMVRFSLATSDYYKDAQGNKVENTQWHNLIAWGNTAKIAEQYLKKGNEVAIEGKLTHRSYEKNGSKHFITEVVVNEMLILTKKM